MPCAPSTAPARGDGLTTTPHADLRRSIFLTIVTTLLLLAVIAWF